jgi:hypothetical protein
VPAFSSFDQVAENISLFQYCGWFNVKGKRVRKKRRKGKKKNESIFNKSKSNKFYNLNLLWIQKLLNKFFSILEASKRTNRIKNVSINSRYCRNYVSLDNFHHRQFKLEFTLSTSRYPWVTVDFCKLYIAKRDR